MKHPAKGSLHAAGMLGCCIAWPICALNGAWYGVACCFAIVAAIFAAALIDDPREADE